MHNILSLRFQCGTAAGLCRSDHSKSCSIARTISNQLSDTQSIEYRARIQSDPWTNQSDCGRRWKYSGKKRTASLRDIYRSLVCCRRPCWCHRIVHPKWVTPWWPLSVALFNCPNSSCPSFVHKHKRLTNRSKRPYRHIFSLFHHWQSEPCLFHLLFFLRNKSLIIIDCIVRNKMLSSSLIQPIDPWRLFLDVASVIPSSVRISSLRSAKVG